VAQRFDIPPVLHYNGAQDENVCIKFPLRAQAVEVEMAVEDMTVAEMTGMQLRELIQSAVKEILQEILGDPDAGLERRPEFEERLRQATAYVAEGGLDRHPGLLHATIRGDLSRGRPVSTQAHYAISQRNGRYTIWSRYSPGKLAPQIRND
jgi:hypothetical protein